MNYQFQQDQFEQDLKDLSEFFMKFVKSFGPSPKKIVDRPIGIFEAANIRFRLMLVSWGISKIIRTVIAIIVGLIVYIVLFRNADVMFKIIIAGAFLIYYIWQLAPHLVKEFKWKDGKITGEAVDGMSGYMVSVYNKQIDYKKNISDYVGGVVAAIMPKPAEAKDKK